MRTLSRRGVLVGSALLSAGACLAMLSDASAREETPLAIKGFDPVAYFALGKPVQGRPDISYEWDEHRYHFASAEHRDLFKADPVRYAPQFANFCAMALARGQKLAANPEHWLINDGKLYLFAADFGPARFRQDIETNAAKANQNRELIGKR